MATGLSASSRRALLSLGDAPFLHLALGVVLVVRWGVKNDTREQVKGKPRLPRAQRQKVHGHLSPVERKNIMARQQLLANPQILFSLSSLPWNP